MAAVFATAKTIGEKIIKYSAWKKAPERYGGGLDSEESNSK